MLQPIADSLPREIVHRIADLVERFAGFGGRPDGGVTRPSFSPADIASREFLRRLMAELGLTVTTDPAGNIFGQRAGTQPQLGAILVGSHLDTVPNGGRYDGALGIIAALEVVRELNRRAIRTRHPVEVVMFTAEEPNSFGISTLGSRACAGRLPLAQLRAAHDGKVSLAEALQRVGGDLEGIGACRFGPGRAAAYLELHVEQGQRLEEAGVLIGIVRAITGIRRIWLTVEGETNHAGTTPMRLRRDALAAAAEVVLVAERVAKSRQSDEMVATVGRLDVSPNAPNVVPGHARLLVELRSPDPVVLTAAVEELLVEARSVVERRGLSLVARAELDQPPEIMHPAVVKALETACSRLGVGYLSLVSMAGHDAAHMAAVTRSGMVFVPSRDGKSHCPDEYTDPAAAAMGVDIMVEALLQLDRELD